MTKEQLQRLSVAKLRELAKDRGLKGVSAYRKSALVDVLSEDSVSRSPGQTNTDMGPDAPVISDRSGKEPSERPEKNFAPSADRKNVPDGKNRQQEKEKEKDVSEITRAAKEAKETREIKEIKGARKEISGESSAADPKEDTSRPERRPIRRSSGPVRHMGRDQIPGKREGRDERGSRIREDGPSEGREGGQNRGREEGSGQPARRQTRHFQPRELQRGRQQPVRPMYDQTKIHDTRVHDTRDAHVVRESAEERQQESPKPSQERFIGDDNRIPLELKDLDSGKEVSGVLEVMQEGYGFIRSDNYLPGDSDVYVSPSQIRRFGLRTGDVISGNTRIRAQQEKFSALLFVKSVDGFPPSEVAGRASFESMTPIFPNERLRMERSAREVAMRIVDLIAPIGKGQRGMIVSPPKAGKTTLLKDISRSVLMNNPEEHIIIMLIDERPEEVTDIREAITGENVEVLYSTFDETPEHHRRVAEMGIERAKRLVELKQDVIILLDSITRLARAYNLIVPASGRTLSGGIDPAALHPPKKFFGAARNMREGGSLTILATALIDTGSKMDDVVYEEFKGTGNMELILDRKLSERRIFPAIDIQRSGTRREDLLLSREEADAVTIMRRALNGMKSEEATERILDLFMHTRSNDELIRTIIRQRMV